MAAVYRVFTEKLGGADAATFVGNRGELFWDPTTTALKMSDGSTAGGVGIGGGGGGSYGDTDVEALFQSYSFHLLPSVNAQYDIGSAEFKVRHLFLSDNTLYYEGNFLKVAQHNAGGAAQSPSYMIPLSKLKELVDQSANYDEFKLAIINLPDAA